jgi:hypothetical protein
MKMVLAAHRKLLIIALGIILLIVGASYIFLYEFTKCDETSLTSNYSFIISLTTDSKLENPIFYIPIPVFRNKTMMANTINMAIIENERKSDGWNLSIVETKYGKMLKIDAKEFVPRVQKMIGVSVATDHIIDTMNATENEPLLSQKFNLTQTQRYGYFIYADYSAPSNAEVVIYESMSGINEWRAVGSTYRSSYNDTLGNALLTGEKHGWFSVYGELNEGGSNYQWKGIDALLRHYLISYFCKNIQL